MAKAIILMFVVTGFVQTETHAYFVSVVNKLQTESNYSKPSEYKFLKISKLKARTPDKGLYKTEGFVVKKYVCPPCPVNAQCKPCMKDNIVISEDNKRLETYSLTNKELVIFANKEKTENLILGRTYRFSIEVTKDKTTNEPINDIRLLGYEPLK